MKITRILYYFSVVAVQGGYNFVNICCATLLLPYITSQLKLSIDVASLLFGTFVSIISLVVQPLVGVISDNTTSKFGRRRPSILFGAITACIGMIMIGYSKLFGQLLGDQKDSEVGESESPEIRIWGLVIAFIGTIVGTTGNAFIGVPARALVSDVIPIEEQHTVQFLNVTFSCFVHFVYYIMAGSMAQNDIFYYAIFAIGIVVLVVTTPITLIFVKEKKNESGVGFANQIKSIGSAFIHCPKKLLILFCLMGGSALATAPFLMNINNYVGINLFNGSSVNNDEKYQEGIQMNMYSLAIASVLGTISSLIFPIIAKGKEVYYYVGSIFVGLISYIVLVVLNYINSDSETVSTGVIVGLFIIVSIREISYVPGNSVPWAIYKKVCPREKMGIYAGVVMSIIILASTIGMIISSVLLMIFDNDIVSVFYYMVVAMFLMCFFGFAIFYVNKDSNVEDEENEKKRLVDAEASI